MNDLDLFLNTDLNFEKIDIRKFYESESIIPEYYHVSNIVTIDDIDFIFLIKKTWLYTYVQIRYRSNIPDYVYNHMSITIHHSFYAENIKKKKIYFNWFNKDNEIQRKIKKIYSE